MPQTGEIDLIEVKANYSLQDITLVDCREIDHANEARLYAEVGFSISLTFLGAILTKFDITFSIVFAVFFLFGIFNTVRYISKAKKIKPISPTKKDSSGN